MSEIKQVGRLRCVLENTPEELFVSLVDYRNNLFTSDDPNRIMEFYDGFENRDQLIQWMKERPRGVSYIHEVEGDKDIIVVIPTADFEGKYAKECRENIFKGLHIVFAESGEIPDPYFNFAHNCNVGIKKAMEYDPKWVVVSNDDMVYVDNVLKLRNELSKNKDNDMVIMNYDYRSNNHKLKIGQVNIFGKIIYKILRCKNTVTKVNPTIFARFCMYEHIEAKFSLNYLPFYHNTNRLLIIRLKHLLHTSFKSFSNPSHFSIYNSRFIKLNEGKLFNESFINMFEDAWVGINLSNSKITVKNIDFKIDAIGGVSLGMKSFARALRDKASVALFNHYVNSGEAPQITEP